MSSPIIEAKNVSLIYSSGISFSKSFKCKALDRVSFTVNKGDVFGVLGRNGSGKSSLLKLLAGVLKPNSGELIYDKKLTRSLLSLGLGFNLELSGRDNALISCMLNGYKKSQAKEKLEEIKEFSELGHFFEQPVKTYSSGMHARLGFASGVMLDVDLLLIDEVLSVGDNIFREKAQKTILEKIRGDQTVVFVSHSDHQIKTICNNCIWLDKGVVKASGDTVSVMRHYQDSSRVA